MSNLVNVLTMGCLCGRESKTVEERKFLVKTRLGEGGFSYVDLVQEPKSRRLFALKRITCHSKEDEKVAQQEVDYMRILQHPNLIPCEAAERIALRGSNQGAISQFLIVMPYYRKGSLWDEIEIAKKIGSPLKEERILQLLRSICEGLVALHRRNPSPLAHRDVKPQNVMLSDDDTPVLMDFGSMGPARVEIKNSYQARAITDLASERCTMTYRAPELFNVETNTTVDEKVDIWSLGCTLYAMCFMESPYEETYMKGGSLALASLSGKVNIPPQQRYSQGLIDMILHMMQVEPQDRPDIEHVIERTESMLTTAQNRV